MRRVTYLILLSLALSAFMPSFGLALAAEGKGKPKEIFLTTEDIKDPYKVLGVVSIKSGDVNLDNLNDKLKDAAKGLGADCVIGVYYFTYQGYIFVVGTAVKIKE